MKDEPDRDGDRATVRLTPSWLARLLGARETLCELEWYEDEDASWRAGWLAVGSRRWLYELDHHALIESALDFVPVADPAVALARDFVQLRRHR